LFISESTEFTRVRSNSVQTEEIFDPSFIALLPANAQAYFNTYGTGAGPTSGVAATAGQLASAGLTVNPINGVTPVLASQPVFDTVNFNVPFNDGGGQPQNTYTLVGRLDYNMSDKTQMFFRAGRERLDQFNGTNTYTAYPQYDTGALNQNQSYLFSVNHTFNNTLLNNTKLSFTRFNSITSFDAALTNTSNLMFVSPQDPATHGLIQMPGLQNSSAPGSETLRETIASYLKTARSLRCEAEQIMIVSGSQQALEISARVLLDPGSHVWVEEPGYRLARDVFSLAGCHLVPVPVDEEGLDVAAGIKLCRKARAAFVTPSHQFPLGVTMSALRRFQLLDWAQDTGSWIIEDDYDSEYRYESLPIASLQGLDSNARVIYIGTFSKVLFPSLRLGYVVIPSDLVDRFLTIRRVMDLGPPSFYQEVLADFIAEGHFSRHIRRMRVLYRERRSALVDSIGKELGSMVEVLGAEAGMHLVVTLSNGSRDLEIAERAALQNLWIWPLSPSYLGEVSRPGFILGFASTPVEEIPRAVRKLRNLLTAK
jgi:DNA-binding transcriptional MocR family regulator